MRGVFFVFKGNLFYVYFTTLQLVLVSCGGGRTSPRAHCGIFENGCLLMYTLEGVSGVANFITAYEESQ